MAIEITDEMRKAVLEELCQRIGHSMAIHTMFSYDQAYAVVGPNNDQLPHVSCGRCGRVWIVSEEPELTYEAAEAKVLEKQRPESPTKGLIEKLRDNRARGPKNPK